MIMTSDLRKLREKKMSMNRISIDFRFSFFSSQKSQDPMIEINTKLTYEVFDFVCQIVIIKD